ncbi:MAG: GNAT family N-acetyltransferase [Myxococcales bacterium]|nr:GNAT family N-acetyltransferase [Myxococcales bacterium]
MPELTSPIAATDLHINGLVGRVERHPDAIQVRTPSNWGFYHGNYLLLPEPPRVDTLGRWAERCRALFDSDPVDHVCLWWDTGELDAATLEHATQQGFVLDEGVSMVLREAAAPRGAPLVRALDPESDWAAIVDLDRRCDPTELQGDDAYVRFKEGRRAGIRALMRGGHAIWYGAVSEGGDLIGQCGLVPYEQWGRFQSVQVHPDHRRRGVCAELITQVATRHLPRAPGGLLLSADPDGPALRLYERLGFRAFERRQSLLLGGGELHVRAEIPADVATVRSVVSAAFGQHEEADIVDALRGQRGVLLFVADRSGSIVGHVAFSPVEVHDGGGSWHSIALGPVAVRASQQRRGVGTALIEHGLEACREAGHELCFVLGHPSYYPRFGFQPALPHGFTLSGFDFPGDAFMVAELSPGALSDRTGEVRYSGAFQQA